MVLGMHLVLVLVPLSKLVKILNTNMGSGQVK